MGKKKIVIPKNFLDNLPVRNKEIGWKTDENGLVTLEVPNKGWANRIAQKFFKRPKISYVHLDEMGSFIWPLIDGGKTIREYGPLVEAHFGEEAKPLYERLARYFQILNSYHFVEFDKQ